MDTWIWSIQYRENLIFGIDSAQGPSESRVSMVACTISGSPATCHHPTAWLDDGPHDPVATPFHTIKRTPRLGGKHSHVKARYHTVLPPWHKPSYRAQAAQLHAFWKLLPSRLPAVLQRPSRIRPGRRPECELPFSSSTHPRPQSVWGRRGAHGTVLRATVVRAVIVCEVARCECVGN